MPALSACLLLSACASQPQQPIAPTPICKSDADCTLKWAAARSYVLAHSGMKIQTYSADFMETFNPPEYGTEIAAQVNKEPLPGGGYAIVARFWCNNFLGCSSPPRRLLDEFNRSVSQITQ